MITMENVYKSYRIAKRNARALFHREYEGIYVLHNQNSQRNIDIRQRSQLRWYIPVVDSYEFPQDIYMIPDQIY